MGLFDFASDVFSSDSFAGGLFGEVVDVLGGSGGSGYNTLPVSWQPYSAGQPIPQSQVYQTAAAVPAVMGAAGAIAGWMRTYPALGLAIQKFRAQRIPMSVERLWSQLKRFGPATLTTMIGAQAVQELIMYKATHKRRRMNVANTKALRKSLRRLHGFETLSHRVTQQLSRSCAPRRRKKCP